MKKIILPIVIVISMLVFSGCFNSKKTNDVASGEAVSFTNLKDAFDSKKSLKCTYNYKDTEGSYESTIYMQGDKFRTVMQAGGQKMNSLFDGSTYYSWIDGQTQGFKMSNDCLNELESDGSDSQDSSFDPNETFFSAEDLDSAFEVKCEKSNMDLSLPSGIDFQDMCEMIQGFTDAFQNINLDQ